ncbi:MAG: transcriptional regulator [Candidatus Gottesmanbacteria bacterium GW2011_GWC2_39_8]|uniref:Probable transcriptional regulatory protein UT63_C0055G0006 n=1 Tax=Candidatus Gottesmanbacteria bacterium GW2011_GWC2_39_8 TaxID=1618450 RepID=A0A0G0PVN1_9BACT|nr:MAG: transcriptional regulator [Candidatus Gottesmanbacteria bacterium GW2011_GWC2_39_8]
MSGHSKWSQIKRQKGAADVKKGAVFTKLGKAISIAVRQGGGITDPTSNFKLRLATEKARESNMPKENIERAIEKGAGQSGGADLEEAIYEAYGPGGAAIIIESATDNKQRTAAEVKNVLDRGGGTLVAQGAISYLFKYVGLITVKKTLDFDTMIELVLEAGGEDLEEDGNNFEIYTNAQDLHKVKESLEGKGFTIDNSELIFKPVTIVTVDEEGTAKKLLDLLNNLESHEDIQKVFSNFDIPDTILTS